jgi:hypothetical protein
MEGTELDRIYQAPASSGKSSGDAGASAELGLLALWEWLRLVYNGVLALEVLALWGPSGSSWDRGGWRFLIGRALAANVLYCAGPVANAYAHWIGLRHRAVTALIFLAGLCLAMLITLISLTFNVGAAFD